MTHLAGTRLPAGLGYATVLPDIDFETYSECGYYWDASAGKYRGPPNSPQGKKGLFVVGTANYAAHPTTEVLSCWFDLKDGHGPEFWRPGLPPPHRPYLATPTLIAQQGRPEQIAPPRKLRLELPIKLGSLIRSA